MKVEDILVSDPQAPLLYDISNAEGKRWLLPAKNMRVGFALYQPGGAKGMALKRYFPSLHRVPGIARIVGAKRCHAKLRPDLHAAVAQAFGIEDFEWALFGGTPSVHRKITIQIFSGDRIYGYCKVADGDGEIMSLFRHEEKILSTLEAAGLKGIPRCVACGTLDGTNVGYFIQDTVKRPDSPSSHDYEQRHADFLAHLRQATKQRMPYEQTDFFATLEEGRKYSGCLPRHMREPFERALAHLDKLYRGKEVEFSAYHADFTPWNTLDSPDGSLYVFDWEYAALSYPPMLDRWHFQLQTAHFEKHLTADQIALLLRHHPDLHGLEAYLAEVISRFLTREKGRPRGDVARSIELWCGLLDIAASRD